MAWSVEADVCGNSTQKWPDETSEHQRGREDSWEVSRWWIRDLNCFLGKGKLLECLGSTSEVEAGGSGALAKFSAT